MWSDVSADMKKKQKGKKKKKKQEEVERTVEEEEELEKQKVGAPHGLPETTKQEVSFMWIM